MSRDIRFCRSFDGVEIATWEQGEGTPLVFATRSGGIWPPSALCEHPATCRIYERLAEHYRLILYDPRGMGLSQRDAEDFSMGAATRDLETVVDGHGLDRFMLTGWRGTARIAVDYAARFPERVTHLILRDPVLQLSDLIPQPRDRAIAPLLEADFPFYLEVMALSLGGWESGPSLAALSRDGTSRDALVRSRQADRNDEFSADLSAITAETLVTHTRSTADSFPLANSRRLASAIPRARMALIDGAGVHAYADADEYADVILGFLGGATPRRQPAPEASSSAGTAVILFTDIVDSTALTERLGDAAFRDASRALDASMRSAMREAGGTPVDGKVLGDGVMAVFQSAAQAIDAARRCVALSAATDLRLHVGIHAGDVIREADNVYGGAVNIAARICGLCEPGEILVSATIRDLARTSAGVSFADRGEHPLKGIEDAVRVFAVQGGG